MRIIMVGDNILFHYCLADFMRNQPEENFVCESVILSEANDSIQRKKPDIVLIDIDLAEADGVSLIQFLVEENISPVVAALTASNSESLILKMIHAGAKGLLHKSMRPDEFVFALNDLYAGKNYFADYFLVNQGLVEGAYTVENAESNYITPRQLQVLKCLQQGMTDKMIAKKLEITESTVKNHMKSLREKLHVDNRLQATLRGLELGLLHRY